MRSTNTLPTTSEKHNSQYAYRLYTLEQIKSAWIIYQQELNYLGGKSIFKISKCKPHCVCLKNLGILLTFYSFISLTTIPILPAPSVITVAFSDRYLFTISCCISNVNPQ